MLKTWGLLAKDNGKPPFLPQSGANFNRQPLAFWQGDPTKPISGRKWPETKEKGQLFGTHDGGVRRLPAKMTRQLKVKKAPKYNVIIVAKEGKATQAATPMVRDDIPATPTSIYGTPTTSVGRTGLTDDMEDLSIKSSPSTPAQTPSFGLWEPHRFSRPNAPGAIVTARSPSTRSPSTRSPSTRSVVSGTMPGGYVEEDEPYRVTNSPGWFGFRIPTPESQRVPPYSPGAPSYSSAPSYGSEYAPNAFSDYSPSRSGNSAGSSRSSASRSSRTSSSRVSSIASGSLYSPSRSGNSDGSSVRVVRRRPRSTTSTGPKKRARR